MSLIRNHMLVPALSKELLNRPHRLLAFNLASDQLWCIGLPRVDAQGHVAGYVQGPKLVSANRVLNAIVAGEIKQEAFHAPGFWAMPDSAYVDEAQTDIERIRRKGRQAARDVAWDVVKPLVVGRPIDELLGAASMRPFIREQANASGVSVVTVYRLLHLFWAHGSIVNGLMPATHRCGGAGQQRAPLHRIGRKPAAFKRGEMPSGGYILGDVDKTRIATAYALIGPATSRSEAYDMLNGSFYSDTSYDDSGTRRQELWPLHLRPTRNQFDYWGRRLSSILHSPKIYGLPKGKLGPTHKGGSSLDLTAAVGQYGMFDATSSDVYLTSLFDRSQKLPPMTRSILLELRSSAVIGVYCGWASPSQDTALQTIYCGATNKVALCKKFDIDIGPDDWPGMLCRTNLVDNGEMRGQKVSEAERLIGFGVEYAKTYAGESKGNVESQHHVDHAKFDHRIPGTTKGKRRERGEPHAADSALWNHWEYTREYLLHIIAYNNEEVPDRAPTEMIIAGVRPTRINVLKWFRDHGQSAHIACDLDQLRALTLPEWNATIQYNGIVLKSADGKRNLSGSRFFSDALGADERFKQASSERRVIPVKVRLDPESLSELWWPTSQALLRIPNVSSDEMLQKKATVTDIQQHMASETVYADQQKQKREQTQMETTLRRKTTTAKATREAKQQKKTNSKPTSKRKQRSNLRANAAAEQNAIANPSGSGLHLAQPAAPSPHASDGSDRTSTAMNGFLSSLFGERATK